MKKTVFLLALSMSIGSLFAAQGALNGLFTINANGDQVCFSQGNLQYQASTGTWRFAEKQTDFIGADNEKASATYGGWIDLISYASSGFDSKHMPYYEGHSLPRDIAGTDYDWGQYCAISNGGNTPGLWRTMTKTEFAYIITGRPNADLLRSLASVTGVNGFVLLPDNWQLQQGLTFTPLAKDYTTNAYSAQQWGQMEEAGAVFLPTAGARYKDVFYDENDPNRTPMGDAYTYDSSKGYYWTSSVSKVQDPYGDMGVQYLVPSYFYFYVTSSYPGGNFANALNYSGVYCMCPAGDPNDDMFASVRLVKDYTFAEEKTLTGKFSVSANKQVSFSQGNLQYRAATDTWQFAENQWDIIGTGNENISSATYRGWIDLFGFGTSGYANKYPWMTSTNEEDYTDGATGDIYNTYFDWGKYNPVVNGGNQAGIWYTMPRDEWDYLLHTRTDADRLQGIATVAGMKGYVLLPDNWQLPDMMWFTPLATSFSVNTYSVSQWRTMENAGAVFLPIAGYRDVTSVEDLDRFAYYWTSSADPDDMVQATEVLFGVGGGYTTMLIDWAPSKVLGRSVRLVSETYGQGVEQEQRDKVQSTKELRNGVLVIRVGDKEYSAQGAVIR